MLSGSQLEEEQIAALRASSTTLPDDEVAETLKDAVRAIADVEREIARLKGGGRVYDDVEETISELEKLHNQFYDIYSKCSSKFRRYKQSQKIFKDDPCSEYEESIELSIYHADSELEKVEAYQDGIANFTAIYKQIAEMDVEELDRIYVEVRTFNVRHDRLIDLVEERESLESRLAPIVEKLEAYQDRAESYMADAGLNCNAERVDFDCGNRCQRRVKDPIFGTYKYEPDMRCLSSCNFQERQAIDDLNEQISDCIDERDWAQGKLEDIEAGYNSERSRIMPLSRQFDRVNDEMKAIINANKSANHELDQFLGQLHPVIFYAMNDEIAHYVFNATSYQPD